MHSSTLQGVFLGFGARAHSNAFHSSVDKSGVALVFHCFVLFFVNVGVASVAAPKAKKPGARPGFCLVLAI
jgi:hypothetical protein